MMDVEEAVRETVQVLNDMKPCKACIHANENCTWCFENKIRIHPSQYGCRKHITNEEAVRELAKAEHQKYCKA